MGFTIQKLLLSKQFWNLQVTSSLPLFCYFVDGTIGTNLTTQSILTKKGVLLLIYSDISEVMGLQQPGFVQDLCNKNNLIISTTYTKPFYSPDYVKKDAVDPLHRFKKASKLILYEITRP